MNSEEKDKIKVIITNSILNNIRFGEITKVLIKHAEEEAEAVISSTNEVELINMLRRAEGLPEMKNLLQEALREMKDEPKEKTFLNKIKDYISGIFSKKSIKPNRFVPKK